MTGRRNDVLIVTSLNISDVICDISSHSMTFWTFAPNSARYVLLVASFPQWRWLQFYRNGTTHLSLVFLMCFSSLHLWTLCLLLSSFKRLTMIVGVLFFLLLLFCCTFSMTKIRHDFQVPVQFFVQLTIHVYL
jgi:hypothetical protein